MKLTLNAPVASLHRLGDLREIGSVVAFLASDKAGYLTGQTLSVDGGLVNSLFGWKGIATMTVMLELSPDLEERLRAEAAEAGEDPETLLQQKVRHMLSTTSVTPTTVPPRVAGLNRGQIWVSEDFDAPLPNEFWLGEEQQ